VASRRLFERRIELYCIQCGTRLIPTVIADRARPACPACGFVLYQQLKVGAGALIEQEGALLLARRGPGASAFPDTWNLPSGYCEADESPADTAVREAAEETGLQVRAGRLVDAYYFDDDPRGSGVLLIYEVEIVGGELQADGREVAALGFFSPDHLPRPLCGGGHDRAITAWQARARDRWQPGAPLHYCPHCSRRLEERLAYDRMRPVCPACGFIHFRNPKVGVSVLVDRGGQVLLVRRVVEPGLGKWCLPSGFVEWDEAPEVAAVRECAEETGLDVALTGLLDVVHYVEDFRGAGINLTYQGRVLGGRLRPGDDADRARFFSPSELPAMETVAFRSHRLALKRWQAASR
jgi:8-oxo-dGTP diphosphatase